MSGLSKKDLVRDFESGGNRSRKRKSEGKEENVGNALFLFRTETVGQGARVSGPLLKQKLATCSYSGNGLHSCLLNARS